MWQLAFHNKSDLNFQQDCEVEKYYSFFFRGKKKLHKQEHFTHTLTPFHFTQVRTLRQKLLPHEANDSYTRGTKRRVYLIVAIALSQPILMWWLTSYVMFGRKV